MQGLIEELEVDRVVLASPIASHEEMLELVRSVRRPDVQVSIVPRYYEIITSHALIDDLEGMPIVTLPPVRLGRSSRVLKRCFDAVVAPLLLLLLAPLLGAVALAIRLDSPGSVLLPAAAARTRRLDVQHCQVSDDVHRRRAAPAGGAAPNNVDGPLFKVKKGVDPRVTRVGALPPANEPRRAAAALERPPR